jgi:anion-transporting  ArsA/GET3 family ATPase
MTPLPRGIDLRHQLLNRQLIVCVGSGGVGKTTVAAALGVEAARLGRKVLVITIDPARRLANSLGLESLGNTEALMPADKWERAGVEPAGSLHAMMLDTRTTFDELIMRVSPDSQTRDRILQNRAYQHINNTLVSTQDYMAVEKLYEIYTRGGYDLVVLDTPPMKNALDFLDASSLLVRFLDERIMRWFLAPYDESKVFRRRVMLGTGAIAFRLLASVFGREFLDELSEFFLSFKDLYKGFRERSEGVRELMADAEKSLFIVVCSPRPTSIDEARFFHEQLSGRSHRGGVFVINNVGPYADRFPHPDRRFLGDEERAWVRDTLRGAVGEAGGDAVGEVVGEAVGEAGSPLDGPAEERLMDRMEASFRESYEASLVDRDAVEMLRSWVGRDMTFRVVPRFRDEVLDFDGLLQIAQHVFAPDDGPPAP